MDSLSDFKHRTFNVFDLQFFIKRLQSIYKKHDSLEEIFFPEFKNNINSYYPIIKFRNLFLGDYSTEAFGDYVAGTNHVLPTSGAAKFSSGLGVIDFMKKSSLVEINKKSFNELSKHVENIADVENLDAHKLSVTIRQTK